ncbi:MAG: hypothetical protein QGI24_09735, partial [Kiritimatiellia bacterium]|nr:hypothetical protein [Kiritimatiellia bacterium]
GKVLEELLKQDANCPVPMEEQVIVLFILQNGFLEGIEPADTRRRLDMMIRHLRTNRPELVDALIDKRQLTDEIREGFYEELDRFCNSAL